METFVIYNLHNEALKLEKVNVKRYNITAEIEKERKQREEMQFISGLAAFFTFMHLKNESKYFNLIKRNKTKYIYNSVALDFQS